MCFGSMGEKKVDIRCRITSGKAEVVAKIGAFHAHDRTEVTQEVSQDQMMGFARIFAAMDFSHVKVGTRFQIHYHIDGVEVTLARGQSALAYAEFEVEAEYGSQLEEEKKKLEDLAASLGVSLWKTGEEFYAFCDRLTNEEDWEFTSSDADMARLREQIISTGSDRA
jgi:adenylate cyclase class IV